MHIHVHLPHNLPYGISGTTFTTHGWEAHHEVRPLTNFREQACFRILGDIVGDFEVTKRTCEKKQQLILGQLKETLNFWGNVIGTENSIKNHK